MDVNDLYRVDPDLRPSVLGQTTAERGNFIARLLLTGLTVRVCRGRKMRRLSSMFDEVSASLQFPLYFGENRAAMDECLADLEGVPVGEGIVLVWIEAEQILVDEDDSELRWLVDSLRSAADVWGSPVEDGEWWDRPAVPFHLVLVSEPRGIGAARSRWTAAGARLIG
jgi:hypothetical protein